MFLYETYDKYFSETYDKYFSMKRMINEEN